MITDDCKTYDIIIKQGAVFTLSFNWKTKRGILKSFTDFRADMMIRTDYDSDELITLSSEDGSIVLGGDEGTFLAKINPEDTADLSMDDFPGVYDIILTSLTDPTIVIRILEGKASLTPSVTRVVPTP